MTRPGKMIPRLGSVRVSRAGNDALVIASLVWLFGFAQTAILEAFERGRRNVHAKARAVPR
jgi:hypothetical protein